MARSKAYLFGGVEIRWHPAIPEQHLVRNDKTPAKSHVPLSRRPEGLSGVSRLEGATRVTQRKCSPARSTKPGGHGTVEWAVRLVWRPDGFLNSYCNTVPTIEGGTHETGLRMPRSPRGLKAYGELSGNKRELRSSPLMT